MVWHRPLTTRLPYPGRRRAPRRCRSTANGSAGVTVLFGSIFGTSSGDAITAAAVGAAVCVLMVALARPLLFATLDPAVAAARGLPVRLLGLGFLALVGACTAEATQAVGALLLLGLLAAPGHRQPVDHPALRSAGAVGGARGRRQWAGHGLSYAVPVLPPSFAIVAVAAGVYAVVLAGSALRGKTRTAVA
jgi:zinc/manganese transport system permease protein